MKTFTVKDTIYGVRINFVVDCSSKEFVEFYNKKYKEKLDLHPDADGCYVSSKDGFRVVWIGKAKDIGILVHEVMHAAFYVLLDRGIDLTIENQEPFTYYTQFLVEEAVKNILYAKNQRKRKKSSPKGDKTDTTGKASKR